MEDQCWWAKLDMMCSQWGRESCCGDEGSNLKVHFSCVWFIVVDGVLGVGKSVERGWICDSCLHSILMWNEWNNKTDVTNIRTRSFSSKYLPNLQSSKFSAKLNLINIQPLRHYHQTSFMLLPINKQNSFSFQSLVAFITKKATAFRRQKTTGKGSRYRRL